MLAVAGPLPRSDEGWAYELKWDGVRAIVSVTGGRVRALSRNGKDLTPAFPELEALGDRFGPTAATLDGELVSLVDGVPNFGRLQQRLHVGDPAAARRRAREAPVVYLVFDLLSYDGHSLLGRTYDERRALLEQLELAGDAYATPVAARDVRGADVLAIARDRGLEGIVAKRRDSRYVPGQRSGDWVKVKNFSTQEVVIGGWTTGRGARAGDLGALLLGLPAAGGLAYAGKVGTGFSAAARAELLAALAPLAVGRSPFVGGLPAAEAAAAHFVRPELVGEVRYGEWTADGRLRHPSWRGLRPDKEPGEVVRET